MPSATFSMEHTLDNMSNCFVIHANHPRGKDSHRYMPIVSGGKQPGSSSTQFESTRLSATFCIVPTLHMSWYIQVLVDFRVVWILEATHFQSCVPLQVGSDSMASTANCKKPQ